MNAVSATGEGLTQACASIEAGYQEAIRVLMEMFQEYRHLPDYSIVQFVNLDGFDRARGVSLGSRGGDLRIHTDAYAALLGIPEGKRVMRWAEDASSACPWFQVSHQKFVLHHFPVAGFWCVYREGDQPESEKNESTGGSPS